MNEYISPACVDLSILGDHVGRPQHVLVVFVLGFWCRPPPIAVDQTDDIRLVGQLLVDLCQDSLFVEHGQVLLKVELLVHVQH